MLSVVVPQKKKKDLKCGLVKCFFFTEFSRIQGSAKFNGWCRVDEKGGIELGVILFQRVGFEQ